MDTNYKLFERLSEALKQLLNRTFHLMLWSQIHEKKSEGIVIWIFIFKKKSEICRCRSFWLGKILFSNQGGAQFHNFDVEQLLVQFPPLNQTLLLLYFSNEVKLIARGCICCILKNLSRCCWVNIGSTAGGFVNSHETPYTTTCICFFSGTVQQEQNSSGWSKTVASTAVFPETMESERCIAIKAADEHVCLFKFLIITTNTF